MDYNILLLKPPHPHLGSPARPQKLPRLDTRGPEEAGSKRVRHRFSMKEPSRTLFILVCRAPTFSGFTARKPNSLFFKFPRSLPFSIISENQACRSPCALNQSIGLRRGSGPCCPTRFRVPTPHIPKTTMDSDECGSAFPNGEFFQASQVLLPYSDPYLSPKTL